MSHWVQPIVKGRRLRKGVHTKRWRSLKTVLEAAYHAWHHRGKCDRRAARIETAFLRNWSEISYFSKPYNNIQPDDHVSRAFQGLGEDKSKWGPRNFSLIGFTMNSLCSHFSEGSGWHLVVVLVAIIHVFLYMLLSIFFLADMGTRNFPGNHCFKISFLVYVYWSTFPIFLFGNHYVVLYAFWLISPT